MQNNQNEWQVLDYASWLPTKETLHRWLQVIGKIRTTHTPWVNHSWGTALYISSRGVTTSLVPGWKHSFAIDVDFISHLVKITSTNGELRALPLQNESVASFYERLCGAATELDIELCFEPHPNEVADATPFSDDTRHCTYDPEAAHRFWQVLVNVHRVFQGFRSQFIGKCSPVHFFWGSLDLAVTRFSGRRAPEHPGGVPNLPDQIVREAYSHEVSSVGFWPGDERYPHPAFYSYAYPEPKGFSEAVVEPTQGAFYHPQLREFILPYNEVAVLPDHEHRVLAFCQSTYEAAAKFGEWDRELLEESAPLSLLQEKQRQVGRMVRRKKVA